jgi:hypothetical protein
MLDKLKNQELSIFEIISMAFSIFKENIIQFLNIAFILGIPLSFILTLVTTKLETVTVNTNYADLINSAEAIEKFIGTGQFKNMLLCEVALLILNGLFYPLITVAVAHMTRDILEGRKADFKKSIFAAVEKGTILIPASILYEIAVNCGLLLFIIPGMIFTVWFYFYKYAIILDDESVMGSLQFSRNLSINNFAKIALSLFALFILENAFDKTIIVIFTSTGSFNMEFISKCLTSVIDTFFWCAASLLYMNLKFLKIRN